MYVHYKYCFTYFYYVYFYIFILSNHDLLNSLNKLSIYIVHTKYDYHEFLSFCIELSINVHNITNNFTRQSLNKSLILLNIINCI